MWKHKGAGHPPKPLAFLQVQQIAGALIVVMHCCFVEIKSRPSHAVLVLVSCA